MRGRRVTSVPTATVSPTGVGNVLDQPSTGAVTRTYTAEGYLAGLGSGGAGLQSITATNAFGQVTVETFGNSLKTTRGYDANSGRLTSIQTGTAAVPASIQNLVTVWRTDSSLYQRKDLNQNVGTGNIDTYSYDALQRVLTQTTNVDAGRTLTFTYDNA